MRVLFDIGHPAHVHLFRNAIALLKDRGHDVLVTASEKDVTVRLLQEYGITHVLLGKVGRGVAEKGGRLSVSILRLLAIANGFQPDVLVGMAPVRAGPVAWALRRPCLALDDTEHASLQRRLYLPFTDVVLTPTCYGLDLGRKQRRYQGYHELAYLHPRRFVPDQSVVMADGLSPSDRYSVVRFVSWGAMHDKAHGGFSTQGKLRLVRELSQHGRVLVTGEGGVPPELRDYAFRLAPHLLHHFLYYASVCVTEGATVASECAVLGTPAVYMNSLKLGYLQEQQERYGLVLNIHDGEDEDAAIAAAVSVMQQAACRRDEWRVRAAQLVQDHVDVTEYLVETLMRVKRVDGR